MTDRFFTWAIVASLGVHLGGLAAAASLGAANGTSEPPAPPVPIEVVRVEPDPPPAAALPPLPPRRDAPRPVRPIPVPKKRETVENRLAPTPPKLFDETREPQPSSAPPEQRFLAGNTALPRTSDLVPSAREGGEAGAGRLFETGDVPVRPGGGTAAGSGAAGRGGGGLASRGGQVEVGGSPGGTLTSLARPLGGYQHMPAYPESARRQGVEGVATLRFQVHTDGSVTEMSVVRSAGHADLDEAAMEAVRKWRFEPARRGKDAVTVWVTLPVRFELRSN